MPSATLNGTRYAYVDEGSGPLIVFGHGLLASREMFRAQIDALKDRYRCVSVDWPGHGESGFDEGGFDFYDLAEDAASLVRELGGEQAIFAGLSQGGMIFMRLALRHPELVRALILLDTSAGPEDAEHLPQYEQLREGMLHGDDATREQLVEVVAGILYGEGWREREPQALAHEKALMLSHDRNGQNFAARAVFDRDDIQDRLGEIDAPTLVICGSDDVATPPDNARALAAGIHGAQLRFVEGAGHHSAIEEPAAVTETIEAFLAGL
jgi:3-oxoadipate enol-lactonase